MIKAALYMIISLVCLPPTYPKRLDEYQKQKTIALFALNVFSVPDHQSALGAITYGICPDFLQCQTSLVMVQYP